jgi:hypothetical protein
MRGLGVKKSHRLRILFAYQQHLEYGRESTMCGIPGWVSLGLDLNREQPTLDEMTETMACREPAVPGSTSGTASTRSATGGSPDTSRRSTNSAASQLCRSVIGGHVPGLMQ